ncbi:hypothetical protein OIU85_029787 [Salix viminalis]|uniref:Uncharacterized protein n=1 Tax=Salix viminalis TaxID=40686 RepID=A0A9Q0QC36_SALVM|nr:hypothetical protein OIU85_029787 [Salix viminalis]
MKIPKLMFSFLLLALTVISFQTAIDAQGPKDAVVDSNDNEVLMGFDYYIAVTSPFDGMSLAREASCPPPVVHRNNLSLLPIKFLVGGRFQRQRCPSRHNLVNLALQNCYRFPLKCLSPDPESTDSIQPRRQT